MQFRNDIQGLRALAFLLVFVFHLNYNWLPGGFLGVDLFFVISGFLMTSIITSSIDKGKFNFIDFYNKRLKRIVPSYYFLLLIVAIVTPFFYLFSDLKFLKITLIRSIFFYSNSLFAAGDSYFGAKLSENPLLHTWSLAIEMQFYLILPVIMLLFRRYLKIIFAAIILMLTLYSLSQINLGFKNQMYFSLFARIPEFLIGGFFALVFKNGISSNKFVNNTLSLISLVILLSCSFLITEHSNFPGALALIPTIASAVILVNSETFLSKILSIKPLVYIGELSYSLYLWHFPIMATIRYNTDRYEFTTNEVALIIVLTFIFAFISYNLIERKFRSLNNKVFYLTIIPVLLITGLYSMKIITLFHYKKMDPIYSERFFGKESHLSNSVQKFGDLSKNDKIFLFGDSHAWSLKPFFDEIGKENNFSFTTMTCDTYPALRDINIEDIPQEGLPFYKEGRKYVDSTESNINKNDIIILAIIGLKAPNSEYTAIEKLAKRIQPNKKLIIINSYPTITTNPIKVNSGEIKRGNVKLVANDNSYTTKRLKEIASHYSNVSIYNLDDDNMHKNLGFLNDTIAYYDKRHINLYGALKLAKIHSKNFNTFLKQVENKH